MERELLSGQNYYVPAMTAAADLGQLLKQRISFGAPAAAATNDIVTGLDADAGASTTVVVATANVKSDAPFGRTVQFTAALATGATWTATVQGRDYLGQLMKETIVVTNANGTTSIVGNKAFQYVDSIVHDGGGSVATTLDCGWSNELGLPYATVDVGNEFEDNVKASAGTFVPAVFTDPQTATTGDPRGTYETTGTLDGTAIFELECSYSRFVNTANNGGLHGVQHYNS